MKRLFWSVVLGCVALTPAGGLAAEPTEAVVVKGSRIVTETVERTPAGIPIQEVTLTYKVSYGDLDPRTSAGKAQLQDRIKEAALAACREIRASHPHVQGTDDECAAAAYDEAMEQVRAIIAAAGS
jgi:UrcA family protein